MNTEEDIDIEADFADGDRCVYVFIYQALSFNELFNS